MGGWSRRRIVVLVCTGLVGLWLVAVAWSLLGAWGSAASGGRHLRHVRAQASIAGLLEPGTRSELVQARSDFAAADDHLDSPVLLPLRPLPVIGRHVRAADRLASGAHQGTLAAESALDDLDELAQRPQHSGPERVETLHDLAAVAGRANRSLAAIDPGSPDALIGPLGRAVQRLGEEQAQAQRASSNLQATSEALAGVLDGPEPYLLLGANNAEMRNGSGMFLSASEIDFDHGAMALGDVRPTADLVLPKGSVPVAGPLARNWPWLDTGRDLRNLGLTADFPQSAQVAVDNWAKVPGGGRVGGVIVLDVDAIRSLLRVVGPVEVDGVRYTPDNVRGELLRKQYQRFEADREGRRDQLGAVARAIFDRLDSGQWQLEDLATELADSVQGRHLLVWSTDAQAAKAWRAVGADGHLTSRSVSVGLINRSAAKVDSWIDARADLSSRRRADGRHEITITYDLHNRAPATGPAYLVGPNVSGLAAGDAAALAVIDLPAGATDVSMTGAEVFLRGGDGPASVIAGRVTVRRGATATVTVRAVLPAGVRSVVVEPSARVPRTSWSVDGEPLPTDRRRAVALD